MRPGQPVLRPSVAREPSYWRAPFVCSPGSHKPHAGGVFHRNGSCGSVSRGKLHRHTTLEDVAPTHKWRRALLGGMRFYKVEIAALVAFLEGLRNAAAKPLYDSLDDAQKRRLV